MPKTLAGAKKEFEKSLNDLLYDAAYKAQMSAVNSGSSSDSAIKNCIKEHAEKMNDEWAKTFADTAAPKLADAVYKYVLEAGITLTPSGSLIFPSVHGPGPIVGTAPITDFKIS